MANVRLILLAVVVSAAAPGSAAAQSFSAGVEAAYDRYTYHFENPSSFDTPQQVSQGVSGALMGSAAGEIRLDDR